MKRKLYFRRDWWTVPELRERLNLADDNDIRRGVIGGNLMPSMCFTRQLQPVALAGGAWVPDGPLVMADAVRLWTVPEYAKVLDTLDACYWLLRDAPTHTEDCRYFALPEPLRLADLLAACVFSEDNILAVEGIAAGLNADLDPRQERSRDKLLVAMAFEIAGWDPAGARSVGVTEIKRVCEAAGLPLSYKAVQDNLRLAWDRCPPQIDAATSHPSPNVSIASLAAT